MSGAPFIAAKGRGRRIAGVAALALGQAAAAGLAAFATRDAFAALHENAAAPIAAFAAIAVSGCVIAALRVAERTVAERLGGDYVAEVREKLFLRAARTSPRTLARRSRGGLALRFVGDMAAIRGWVALGLPRLISAAITIPATLIVLVLLDPRLALAATTPLAMALAALAALGWPLARTHRRERRLRARLAAEMTEQMAHGASLRLVGRVGTIRARLRARSRKLIDAAANRAWMGAVARAVPDAGAGLAAAAILATAFANGATPAVAAGALAALGLAVQPLRRLAEVHDRRQAWLVARDKLSRALATQALPARDGRRRAPRPGAPALSIEGARLGSGPRLDAALAPGEVALLTGPAGAGKSLLLLAAAGLEPVEQGRLRVFGQPPSTLPTGVVAYIGSHAPLIRGTLRRNLTLGLGAPAADAQKHAITAAGLEALAARPGGLEAWVSDSGSNLSATERAHLILARGLLARPRLYLVDAEDCRFDPHVLGALVTHARRIGASVLMCVSDPSQPFAVDTIFALSKNGLAKECASIIEARVTRGRQAGMAGTGGLLAI